MEVGRLVQGCHCMQDAIGVAVHLGLRGRPICLLGVAVHLGLAADQFAY